MVERALKAFARCRSYLISGRKNYLLAQAGRMLPRATVASMTARVMQPRKI